MTSNPLDRKKKGFKDARNVTLQARDFGDKLKNSENLCLRTSSLHSVLDCRRMIFFPLISGFFFFQRTIDSHHASVYKGTFLLVTCVVVRVLDQKE